MQLGQLQMSKKLLKCLKKRKERSELYLLNVYVFYARGCKSTLAVTPTLHCWSKKKEKYREKNETFSAAGSARTMGPVSGAGMAQLHRVAHASVTAQLLQTRAVVQWSQSRATACRGWKRSPVLSPPPGTTPGWENFLLADWHRLKRQCSQDLWPSTVCLLTATFLTQQPKRCWAVCAGLTRAEMLPSPFKRNPLCFPLYPVLTAILLHGPPSKNKLPPKKYSQGAISYDFCFYQNLSLGFPKRTHEGLWIGPLTKYITIAKWKCHWFNFFDARSEKQEVAENIFISKELNKITKNTHNSAASFETT